MKYAVFFFLCAIVIIAIILALPVNQGERGRHVKPGADLLANQLPLEVIRQFYYSDGNENEPPIPVFVKAAQVTPPERLTIGLEDVDETCNVDHKKIMLQAEDTLKLLVSMESEGVFP